MTLSPPPPLTHGDEIHSDTQAMQLALTWAQAGLFITTPNPRVGCVLVKNHCIIGLGHTQPPGQAHAEIAALHDAAAHGHDPADATAYVTLEPCSHHGRTPPCVDALIAAKIRRVVVAIADPNPQVNGAGLARLRQAGIEVVCGVPTINRELEDTARELNIGFFTRMQRGTPWVRLKAAASLDGKTALHNGVSQWITSPESRADGHAWRARACAILTGIGTVEQDNPQLNVRAVATPRQPQRIVLDSHLRIDLQSHIVQQGNAWIVTTHPDSAKIAQLEALGAEVIVLPSIDLPALMQELGRRQINELHVEAGHTLNGALIRAGCVDELLLYLAPTLLGHAQGLFDLPALSTLDARRMLAFHDIKQIGPDLRVLARFVSS